MRINYMEIHVQMGSYKRIIDDARDQGFLLFDLIGGDCGLIIFHLPFIHYSI